MPIDITNKEEKQIALTGAEIEETLLQAHLSKDAIEKINGLKASASEIDILTLASGDIRLFGAMGGGVDDTSSIMAALAANQFAYIPEGTWYCKDVYLAGSQCLYGAGKEKSVLKAYSTPTYSVVYANQPFSYINNLTIDGNKDNFTGVNGFASYGERYGFANFSIVLEHVQIRDCSNYGVYFKGGNNFTMINTRVTNCDNTLVYLDSAHKYYLDNCNLEISNSRAIESVSVTSHGGLSPTSGVITNCWFEQISSDTVIYSNVYNTVITNNHFNSSETSSELIRIGGSSDFVNIENNNFISSLTNKITVEVGCTNVNIGLNRGVGVISSTTGILTKYGINDLSNNAIISGYGSGIYAIYGNQTNISGALFNRDNNSLLVAKSIIKADGANTQFLSNQNLRLRAGGSASGKNIEIGDINGSSTYTQGHIVMGGYHIWVSTSGKLMIKNGIPTTDADGTIVGEQIS